MNEVFHVGCIIALFYNTNLFGTPATAKLSTHKLVGQPKFRVYDTVLMYVWRKYFNMNPM